MCFLWFLRYIPIQYLPIFICNLYSILSELGSKSWCVTYIRFTLPKVNKIKGLVFVNELGTDLLNTIQILHRVNTIASIIAQCNSLALPFHNPPFHLQTCFQITSKWPFVHRVDYFNVVHSVYQDLYKQNTVQCLMTVSSRFSQTCHYFQANDFYSRIMLVI